MYSYSVLLSTLVSIGFHYRTCISFLKSIDQIEQFKEQKRDLFYFIIANCSYWLSRFLRM